MYDCVFPTRTARFGNALTRRGILALKRTIFANDLAKIEEECECPTCITHTRATIFKLFENNDSVGCQLVSIHNIAYQMRLMKDIRRNIEADTYPAFIKSFMYTYYRHSYQDVDEKSKMGKSLEDVGKCLSKRGYPIWIENALASVNVFLE